MENQTAKDGKVAAIISHFTIFGTIIAFLINGNKKNSFASFHIRQMMGLNLFYLINHWIVYPYLGKNAGWIVGVGLFVLWIISFMGVMKEEKKLVPFVGEKFQDWFKGI
jgi:uncharacterized membrane protein